MELSRNNNIDIETNTKAKSLDSREVDMNQTASKEEKIMMNFNDESIIDNQLKQPTKDASLNDRNTNTGDKKIPTLEEARQTITDLESGGGKSYQYKDFEDISTFILNFVDTLFGVFFRMWSGDSAVNPYEIPKAKMDMLKNQLTLILIKYQKKFSVEFMFIATLLLVYSVPFMKAREYRKNRLLRERAPAPKKPEPKAEPKLEKTFTAQPVKEEKIEVAEIIPEETIILPPKRKRGGQRKS